MGGAIHWRSSQGAMVILVLGFSLWKDAVDLRSSCSIPTLSGVRMARVVVMLMVLVLKVIHSNAQGRGESCQGPDGQGICDSLSKCEPLRLILQAVQAGNAPSSSLAKLRNAICHFENDEPLVCCAGASPSSTPVSSQPPQLPQRCGTSALLDRIIDGEDAMLLAWPWMALLRGTVDNLVAWFCGGSLISERYVLTAAHCFKPVLNVQLEFVRIGEHTLSVNPDCEKGVCAPEPQDIPVDDIIIHPEYGRPCDECNDIALLRLSQPVKLHPLHVVPVCLPINPLEEMGYPEERFTNKSAWAAGWGSTSRVRSADRQPDTLQQVLLPIQELRYCDSLRSGYPDPRMVLCAGGDGKDTCRGDSGGPIILSNIGDTKKFVVGVTSLGPVICGAVNTQGLYTNVHYYVEWILRNIRP